MARYLKYIDSILFPLAGLYAIYLYTKYSGIGVSPDSIMYTSAARSLHSVGSLITFNNTPITDFPVFYPVFLWSILAVTQVDPIAAGPILNGLLFAIVIFLSGRIIERFKPNSLVYKWLMLTAIILSPALLEIYSYLWSETLFVVILLVFIIAGRQYFVKHTLNTLLLFAFIAALSSITRYAGITLIGTGGLLLLMDGKLILQKKVRHIIIYSIAASSFLALNLLRNILATTRLTGPREASFTPFMKNVYYFGTVMCDWAGLTERSYPYATVFTILLFVGLIAILIYTYSRKTIGSYETLLVTFTIVYGAFIIISSTFSRYERINSRLLSPFFIPLLLSCTYLIIGFIKLASGRWKYAALSVFTVLMLGFSYQELLTDSTRYESESEYGVPGYTDDSWNKSDFATYLKKDHSLFKPGVPVYSDANEALYFLSGDKVKLLPHRYFTGTIQNFYKVKRYYLVWFDSMDNPELISLKDILKVENLKLLKKFNNGSVDDGYIGGAIYEYDGN